MQAWKLFAHSVRQVFGNFGVALRISALPSILLIAVGAWLLHSMPTQAEWAGKSAHALFQSYPFVPVLLTWLVGMIVPLWIAVAWHRFILRNEAPGAIMPPWHGWRVLAYLGRLILLTLIVGIPAMIVSSFLLPVFGSVIASFVHSDGTMAPAIGVVLFLIWALFTLPMFWAFNRLAAVLPATALGERLTIGEAWRMTGGDDATFLLLPLILMLAFGAEELVLALLAHIDVTALTLPVTGLVYWLQVIIGASILTTIYGHYIEKRPLVGAVAKA